MQNVDRVRLSISLAKKMLSDSIWKSANVEGLGTTFPNTEAILYNMPVTTKRDEVLFILNMKSAWTFLLENLDYNNCFMLIREFNKICMRDLNIAPVGILRTSDVSIGGTSWKPSIPVENLVFENIKELNAVEDAEMKAVLYFCYLCKTQLFYDGNKRVAQLMANKILISAGIGILSIPVELRDTFMKLLVSYYEDDNNMFNLIQFLRANCIQRI